MFPKLASLRHQAAPTATERRRDGNDTSASPHAFRSAMQGLVNSVTVGPDGRPDPGLQGLSTAEKANVAKEQILSMIETADLATFKAWAKPQHGGGGGGVESLTRAILDALNAAPEGAGPRAGDFLQTPSMGLVTDSKSRAIKFKHLIEPECYRDRMFGKVKLPGMHGKPHIRDSDLVLIKEELARATETLFSRYTPPASEATRNGSARRMQEASRKGNHWVARNLFGKRNAGDASARSSESDPAGLAYRMRDSETMLGRVNGDPFPGVRTFGQLHALVRNSHETLTMRTVQNASNSRAQYSLTNMTNSLRCLAGLTRQGKLPNHAEAMVRLADAYRSGNQEKVKECMAVEILARPLDAAPADEMDFSVRLTPPTGEGSSTRLSVPSAPATEITPPSIGETESLPSSRIGPPPADDLTPPSMYGQVGELAEFHHALYSHPDEPVPQHVLSVLSEALQDARNLVGIAAKQGDAPSVSTQGAERADSPAPQSEEEPPFEIDPELRSQMLDNLRLHELLSKEHGTEEAATASETASESTDAAHEGRLREAEDLFHGDPAIGYSLLNNSRLDRLIKDTFEPASALSGNRAVVDWILENKSDLPDAFQRLSTNPEAVNKLVRDAAGS